MSPFQAEPPTDPSSGPQWECSVAGGIAVWGSWGGGGAAGWEIPMPSQDPSPCAVVGGSFSTRLYSYFGFATKLEISAPPSLLPHL